MIKNLDFVATGYPSMDTIIECSGDISIGRTSIISKLDKHYYFGGCNVNIACFCGYMGMNTAVMMKMGKDFESSGFKAFLENCNVNIDGVKVIEEDYNSCAYLISNEVKNHITLFYPGAMSERHPFEVDENIIRASKYGVITVGNCLLNKDFFMKCKRNNVPMILGMKWDTEAFPLDFLKDLIESCKVLVMNEFEEEQIVKSFGFSDITDCFKSPLVETIVVTLGRNGSCIYHKESNSMKKSFIPIADIVKPVDSSGVGDAYIAGFMKAYLDGKEIEKCGRLGTITASFIIEKQGCLANIQHFDKVMERYKSFYKEEYE